jgi:hypothetical protein
VIFFFATTAMEALEFNPASYPVRITEVSTPEIKTTGACN